MRARVWVVGGSRGIGATLAAELEPAFAVERLSRGSGFEASAPGAAAARLAGGTPWGWVHCPGEFLERDVLATTDAEWLTLLESNLWSFVRLARDVIPAMVAAGGGRVLAFGAAGLGSNTGKVRGPAYFAVKAALWSVVRTLARDYAEAGVTVNMLSPGLVAHPHSHRASQERIANRVPAGRLGTPGDLVGLVRLLLSDEAAYLTGQEIAVDGGLGLV